MPMSAPISSFSKLSITQGMSATRGRSRGHHGSKGKEPAVDDDDSSSDSDNTEDIGLFAVDHCRQYGTKDREHYYAFQIAYAQVETVGVRISTSDPGNPTCSCDASECRHVPWLLEQLGRTTGDVIEDTEIDLYEHISTLGLRNVCEELHWELREGADSHAEETTWQLKKDYISSKIGLQTRGMIKERVRVVRDILATLSPVIAEDFRGDIFEPGDDVNLDGIFVPRDLEATLSRLLIVDDNMFYQFKSLVSRNDRASDYFRKMADKAEDTCRLLDEFVQNGPAAGQHDLPWCARTLQGIVDSISTQVKERAPLNQSSREEAARALVSILGIVVNRNHDAYQNITWPRKRPHGEPQTDRNLYERLIGSTSRSNPAGVNFVINALLDLPDASKRCVEDLEANLAKLKTIGWGPAPQAYLDKLIGFIAQLKGGPGPSAASGKRPASSMDRKVKRMK